MTDELGLCRSAAMQSVRDNIAKVAGTNVTVLLLGESGVGKEVVARAIHTAPPRASHPFVKVNCAAVPEDLLESELFGHDRGAFTGTDREKPGKFELARHGTIFLDEIGEIPPRLQAKLLHILQDGEFARVGGEKIIHSDVRVVAATNRDLETAIREGQFREDLYYRLNVIAIRIPPLRDRQEEIPVLVDHFLRRFNTEHGRSVAISPAMMRRFTDYSWPGNVRELENAVKRMVVLGTSRRIHQEVSNAAMAETPAPSTLPAGLKTIGREAARTAERVVIKVVLDRVRWNRVRAARLLQISYRTLLYKIGDYGLAKPDSENGEERIVA
jgi:transcriptional regulator with GAF, ATPase, and Fis domain